LRVIELHDCFSANELLLYEALRLCGEGEAPKLIDDGDTTDGGRWVVNPSGGLIAKGQVNGVNAALQYNIGLGGVPARRTLTPVPPHACCTHRATSLQGVDATPLFEECCCALSAVEVCGSSFLV
jgi:hypothetical protein